MHRSRAQSQQSLGHYPIFIRLLMGVVGCCLILAMPNIGIAAPDDSLGMALMSAVTLSGHLVRGSGVSSLTNPSSGEYVLTFDRDVTDCTWVANAIEVGSFATVDYGPNNGFGPNQLTVFTDSIAGATSNSVSYHRSPSDFNLIVFCPR